MIGIPGQGFLHAKEQLAHREAVIQDSAVFTKSLSPQCRRLDIESDAQFDGFQISLFAQSLALTDQCAGPTHSSPIAKCCVG